MDGTPQLDWENENYQATKIQTIWRFKLKQRANQREREREEREAKEAEEAANKEWAVRCYIMTTPPQRATVAFRSVKL